MEIVIPPKKDREAQHAYYIPRVLQISCTKFYENDGNIEKWVLLFSGAGFVFEHKPDQAHAQHTHEEA